MVAKTVQDDLSTRSGSLSALRKFFVGFHTTSRWYFSRNQGSEPAFIGAGSKALSLSSASASSSSSSSSSPETSAISDQIRGFVFNCLSLEVSGGTWGSGLENRPSFGLAQLLPFYDPDQDQSKPKLSLGSIRKAFDPTQKEKAASTIEKIVGHVYHEAHQRYGAPDFSGEELSMGKQFSAFLVYLPATIAALLKLFGAAFDSCLNAVVGVLYSISFAFGFLGQQCCDTGKEMQNSESGFFRRSLGGALYALGAACTLVGLAAGAVSVLAHFSVAIVKAIYHFSINQTGAALMTLCYLPHRLGKWSQEKVNEKFLEKKGPWLGRFAYGLGFILGAALGAAAGYAIFLSATTVLPSVHAFSALKAGSAMPVIGGSLSNIAIKSMLLTAGSVCVGAVTNLVQRVLPVFKGSKTVNAVVVGGQDRLSAAPSTPPPASPPQHDAVNALVGSPLSLCVLAYRAMKKGEKPTTVAANDKTNSTTDNGEVVNRGDRHSSLSITSTGSNRSRSGV